MLPDECGECGTRYGREVRHNSRDNNNSITSNRIILEGHLGVFYFRLAQWCQPNQHTMVEYTSSLDNSVSENSPLVRLPVIGNRLDQVAVGGAHADPERGNS